VSGAIVGFRRPAQVDPSVAAANLDLTAAEVAALEAGG
jgi:aryl-alcohol dehydrogenase-like predicted oxidoreductase